MSELKNTVQNVYLNDGNELTIREGKAPDPVNPENQRPVHISGNIDAPSNYYHARKESGQFVDTDCIVNASYKDRRIELKVHQDKEHLQVIVEGKMKMNHRLAAFSINNPNVTYTRDELSRLAKFNRSAFSVMEEGMNFVKVLKDFSLSYNQAFEDRDDNRGNKKLLVQTVIEKSNIPEKITLKLPVFEGDEPQEIEVEVLYDVESTGDVRFYLESIDLADLIETKSIEIVDSELKSFGENVAIIYY